MIAANELRVGNRFIRELYASTKGLEYDKDFVLTEEWMSKLFGNDISIGLQDLFPIPLSPEVLMACGFKRGNRDWSLDGNFFLKIEEHGEWLNGVPIAPVKYMVYKSGIGAITEVKTLHHLQNLYFAIYQTELIYQPSKSLQ